MLTQAAPRLTKPVLRSAIVGDQNFADLGAKVRRIACYASALATTSSEILVGLGGLEPPTSPLSGVRSNHLSYRPGFACLRTAWTALQLSFNRSRTCVRSLFHSTCALPADPNPAPNPEIDSAFVANRYRACIDPFALFISQPSNSCGL